MAIELSLDAVKDMKKADFLKGFKNKAVWKKAKAVIIMVDYKLDGKKAVVAIPFKKETDMKAEMKRLKKDKLHFLKKSAGGTIEFLKGADGNMEAKIEIIVGGLAPEILLEKGQKLFNAIKVNLQALQSAEAAADAAAAAAEDAGEDDAAEEDTDENDMEDNEGEGDDSWEEEGEDDAAGSVANKEFSEEQIKKKEEFKAVAGKIEAKIAEIKNQLKMS